jgi:uncharacterized protein (TIGR02246 family)
MKTLLCKPTVAAALAILILGVAVALGAIIVRAQSTDDEAAIRKIVQEEADAWTRGDATAYSLHFADDGTFTNILGDFYIGHEVFLKRHEFLFQVPYRATTLHHDVVSLKFPRPEVAIVEVLTFGHWFSKARARASDGCKRAPPDPPAASPRQGQRPVEDRHLPQRRCEGADTGTRSKLTLLSTSTLYSSDNDPLFSSLRSNEEVSQSSDALHCRARRTGILSLSRKEIST